MRHTTPYRSLPSIASPGVALVLSVCWGGVAAQSLPLHGADWTTAALMPRGDEAPLATTLEVGTARGHVSALASLPPGLDGRTNGDVAGVSYRVWMSRGRADVGLGFGSLGFVVPPMAGRNDVVTTLVGALPTVTLGVRYHLTDRHLFFADASRARGLGADPGADYVSAKVGLEWRPARSTMGFEQGALGMQLDSGYQLSLKARRGGPALYLRGRF
jgi:hypothetical protein